MNENQSICKKMNIPPRTIINRNMFLFIYNLIKFIIYDEDKPERLGKINLLIKIANEKIYPQIENSSNYEERQVNPKELTTEYSKENFENIILFLKQQNKVYVGDILGSILIQICGFMSKSFISFLDLLIIEKDFVTELKE